MLGPELSDVDGNAEKRSDAVSVFNGPPPEIRLFKSEADEISGVANWLIERSKAGVLPHEIGLFVRSNAQLPRATAAAKGRKDTIQDS